VQKRKNNPVALYTLIKITSGAEAERPFLCTLLTILLLTPCCLTISSSQKPVDTKPVTAVSQKGCSHQTGSHQAPETASEIHEKE